MTFERIRSATRPKSILRRRILLACLFSVLIIQSIGVSRADACTLNAGFSHTAYYYCTYGTDAFGNCNYDQQTFNGYGGWGGDPNWDGAVYWIRLSASRLAQYAGGSLKSVDFYVNPGYTLNKGETEIVAALERDFDVSREKAETNVSRFIGDLAPIPCPSTSTRR